MSLLYEIARMAEDKESKLTVIAIPHFFATMHAIASLDVSIFSSSDYHSFLGWDYQVRTFA